MKRSWRENGKAAALALAVAAPMCYVLQISMGIALPFWYTLLFSVLSAAFLELVNRNKWTAIGIPAAILLCCGYIWLILDKDQRQFFVDYYWWVVDFLYNGGKYPLGNAVVLTAGTSFLVTLYVWLLGRRFFFFPAVFAFVVAFLLFKWLQGLDIVLFPGVLACGGLILLWAKSFQRKTAKKSGKKLPVNGIALYLLPVAALIAILSYACVPTETAERWQNRQVYDMLERVNNYIADYSGFTRPRHAFTIAAYGFMPMGNRLGGPTELTDDEVLHVTASKRMLLRGIVYNNYESNRWTDTTNSPAFRFNENNKAAADNAFDVVRPQLSGTAATDFNRFVEPVTVHVQPLYNSASTLFVPFRGVATVSSDKFLGILPKFNAKGEVFAANDVHAGYGYTVGANYLNYGDSGFAEMMNGLQGLADTSGQMDAIRQAYAALPKGIEPDVYDIVNRIVSGNPVILKNSETKQAKDAEILVVTASVWMPDPAGTDYEKALQIKKFLSENFQYTLKPDIPPEDQDFVSYFVCHDRKGYCTYFASAMAVMARIAGIPSRYVEGYMLPEKGADDDAYVVRNKDAHAWAELYFEGVGWIPFDATPSGQSTGGEPSGDAGGPGPIPTPTPPAFDEGGDDTGGAGAVDTLTWEDVARYLWLLPVAACAFILCWLVGKMVWARVRTSRRYLGKKFADMRRRCAFLYLECVRMLVYYNYPIKKGETLYAYAARIDRWLRLESGTFAEVAELISKLSYSDYAPAEADAEFMAKFRAGLAKYTYHAVGPWFYLVHHVLGFKVRETRRREG